MITTSSDPACGRSWRRRWAGRWSAKLRTARTPSTKRSPPVRTRVPGTEVLIFTMHDTATLVREVLEAGARGFLLKSDARRFLIAAVESLAAHKPFFTGKVSQALLETYLSKGAMDEGALTSREKAVVQLIAEGKTNKQIADILNISTKTVETHRALALHKLNLDTTAALIRYAIRNKLVEA